MKHDFKFFVKEGAGNMFSHGFMSFAAIGVTVACLLIMGTFTLVAYNANENLADLQQENAIVAFVDETLDEDQARALQAQVEAVDNVEDCSFVTRTEARDAYVAKYDAEGVYGDLLPEVFRHRYELLVKVDAAADVSVFRNELQRLVSGAVKAPWRDDLLLHARSAGAQALDRVVGRAGVQHADVVRLTHGIHKTVNKLRLIFADSVNTDPVRNGDPLFLALLTIYYMRMYCGAVYAAPQFLRWRAVRPRADWQAAH